MANGTAIEWAHATFNPWRGCSKVATGCTHCYAEKNVGVKLNGITWGEVWQGGQRVVMAESGWKAPLKWARDAARDGVRRRVFCSSLADVLEVPEMPPFQHLTTERRERVNETRKALDAARERLWDTIRQTVTVLADGTQGSPETGIAGYAGLDWLLLTKRPENWRLVPEDVRPLVWLGTSVSDQKTADEWVPRLLAAQGFRLRFLSVEPLVGPVDLSAFFGGPYVGLPGDVVHDSYNHGIGWVIVGGESGSKARPCAVEWVRDIVKQCREANVPCFVKQLGSAPALSIEPTGNFRTSPETGRRQVEMVVKPLALADKKGGDIREFPADLQLREVPLSPEARP